MADPSIGWQERLPTPSLQAEYFLLKYPESGRDVVMDMKVSFIKFDARGVAELQEDEAMRLLESRKETKRAVELREMIKEMDFDKNRQISLLEWLCAYFKKSWKELHTPGKNQAELEKAIQKIRLAEQKEIEAIQKLRADEKKKQEVEEQRQRDLQKTGIKGAAAKFHWAANDTADTTKSNEERLKAEAAARKAEKDKKKAEEDKAKLEEEARQDILRKQEELKQKEEEDKRIAEEKERERKAKVQAALKNKFGSNN